MYWSVSDGYLLLLNFNEDFAMLVVAQLIHENNSSAF